MFQSVTNEPRRRYNSEARATRNVNESNKVQEKKNTVRHMKPKNVSVCRCNQ